MKILNSLILSLWVLNAWAVNLSQDSLLYARADSNAIAAEGMSLTNMEALNSKLVAGLETDLEKFRAIYYWITHNIASDYRQHEKINHYRRKYANDSLKYERWKRDFNLELLKQLIETQKTTCSGYSTLLCQMARLNQIPCRVVNGYARSSTVNTERLSHANHAWVAVYLNNKWQLCDPTWSAGMLYVNGDMGIFNFDFNPGYFLCEPTFFALNHFPLDTNWLLCASNPKLEDFCQNPILYGSAFKLGVFPNYQLQLSQSVQPKTEFSIPLELFGSINPDDLRVEIDNAYRTYSETTHFGYDWTGTPLLRLEAPRRVGTYTLHVLHKKELLFSLVLEVE